ncbi:unnamed protein product [Phyllotreta striolata]|uniref:peptidylprolyl isomerase n=1 Tax=Phyllotreta striolata TaxID=444603 RepID=A0A9N9TTR8_PHYSR|nr:unnamed protein product [Phyllotreta striolata]
MSESLIESEKHVDNSEVLETSLEQQKTENEVFIKNETETDNEEYEHEKPAEVEEIPEPQPEWVDLLGSGAIMKKLLTEGKPDSRPQRSEKCIINYTLYLKDETVVESASNFQLNLGESDVIQGLDVALGLMNIGEKCRLQIEPRLAFSKKGLASDIPPDATVIYDVELVQVEPEDVIDSMTIGERRQKGNKKRERGNWWYVRGENNIAIQCYRRALDYLDEVEGGEQASKNDNEKSEILDSDLQSILEDRISVCNNMAAAQIKMENYNAALSSLQIVLKCQPNNVKAHFRKAKVFIGKNDLSTAMKCLLKAKELAPNDAEIQKEIAKVTKLLDKQKTSEKELARRMFNGKAKTGDVNKRKKKARGSRLAFWGTLGAAVALGTAGILAYRFKV